jgi:hypothetical protein
LATTNALIVRYYTVPVEVSAEIVLSYCRVVTSLILAVQPMMAP